MPLSLAARTFVHRAACIAVALVASARADAQTALPRTAAALLPARLDTIAVYERVGGELGARTGELLLVRGRSGFSGRMTRRLIRQNPYGSDTSANRRCDSTVSVRVPLARVQRLIARLGRTRIAPGAASPRLPVSDIFIDDRIRLAGAGVTVEIRDGRNLVRGDSTWRADVPLAPFPRRARRTELDEVYEALRAYVEPRWRGAFEARCMR